jgi:hypothetical protein
MIISQTVKIRVNNKNINHYINQGLDVIYGCVYEMDIKFLPRYSKYKILSKCETCGVEKELSIQKYHQNWERSESYNCKSCNNITYKKSMLKKYGHDNPSNVESSIQKRKETCLEKYGNEYIIASEYSKGKTKKTLDDRFGGHQINIKEIKDRIMKNGRITKIERGFIVPDNELSDWMLYRRIVRKITERNRKYVMENWDGLDYYDGEYIKDNFKFKHTDTNFPTLDHKESIIHGFRNNIPPEDIGNIENLCITKKGINSSKSFLKEDDYINKKNQS